MNQRIVLTSIVVNDYDKAIDFYTKVLSFELVEDTKISEKKRWVVVGPKGGNGGRLLLAKAKNELEKSRIGNQTGGRVFMFLHTDDFERDYQNLLKYDVEIIREPENQPHGRVLVFRDCFGNLWDLIQPTPSNSMY